MTWNEHFPFIGVLRYRSQMDHPPPKPAQPQSASLEQFRRAASEVDRTLLQLSLRRSPRERLRVATRAQKALSKFHRHAPE